MSAAGIPFVPKFLSNIILANKRTAGVTRFQDKNLQDKLIVHPAQLALTNNSAQSVFTVTLADGGRCAGVVFYEVVMANASSQATVSGMAMFSAQRTGATTTGAINAAGNTAIANTGATAAAAAWTFTDGGSGVATFNINGNSTIASPTTIQLQGLTVFPILGTVAPSF